MRPLRLFTGQIAAWLRGPHLFGVATIGGLATLGLAACGTTMSAGDCASADWRALGYDDGRQGLSARQFERRERVCTRQGVTANLPAYEEGRGVGLEQFCTNESGFEAGLKDIRYLDVCPAEQEGTFLAGYDLGQEALALSLDAKKSETLYRKSVTSLDRHRYNLVISENRYENPTLANEDRETARLDLEHHAREIDRLEVDIPRYKLEAASTQEAYTAFLETLPAVYRAMVEETTDNR
ncbi:MAG: DUF2799 domain-containing protein [Pseudomonadota bacterium]